MGGLSTPHTLTSGVEPIVHHRIVFATHYIPSHGFRGTEPLSIRRGQRSSSSHLNLMRVLRPTRVAWRYLHTQHASQQRLELLARAFSDAVDPVERPLSDYDSRTTSNVVSSASLINGSKNSYDTNTLKTETMETETMQFLASY